MSNNENRKESKKDLVKNEIMELFFINCTLVALAKSQDINGSVMQIPKNFAIEIEKKMKLLCPEVLNNCISYHGEITKEITKEHVHTKKGFGQNLKSFFKKSFFK